MSKRCACAGRWPRASTIIDRITSTWRCQCASGRRGRPHAARLEKSVRRFVAGGLAELGHPVIRGSINVSIRSMPMLDPLGVLRLKLAQWGPYPRAVIKLDCLRLQCQGDLKEATAIFAGPVLPHTAVRHGQGPQHFELRNSQRNEVWPDSVLVGTTLDRGRDYSHQRVTASCWLADLAAQTPQIGCILPTGRQGKILQDQLETVHGPVLTMLRKVKGLAHLPSTWMPSSPGREGTFKNITCGTGWKK